MLCVAALQEVEANTVEELFRGDSFTGKGLDLLCKSENLQPQATKRLHLWAETHLLWARAIQLMAVETLEEASKTILSFLVGEQLVTSITDAFFFFFALM